MKEREKLLLPEVKITGIVPPQPICIAIPSARNTLSQMYSCLIFTHFKSFLSFCLLRKAFLDHWI